jgi:hypothetical protein
MYELLEGFCIGTAFDARDLTIQHVRESSRPVSLLQGHIHKNKVLKSDALFHNNKLC